MRQSFDPHAALIFWAIQDLQVIVQIAFFGVCCCESSLLTEFTLRKELPKEIEDEIWVMHTTQNSEDCWKDQSWLQAGWLKKRQYHIVHT
jgi:hypothetical protein